MGIKQSFTDDDGELANYCGAAVTFITTDAYTLNDVQLKVADGTGDPNYSVDVELYAVDGSHKPTGSPLLSIGTFTQADTSGSASWITLDGLSYDLSAATEYAIACTVDSPDGTTNFRWARGNASYDGESWQKQYFVGPGCQPYSSYSSNFNFRASGVSLPTKATTPGPANENEDTSRVTANLTWADGGNTNTFTIYFGKVSGALTELESGIAVGSPTWASPYVILEISDYNPAANSGYRSPAIGDQLSTSDDATTYTIIDIERGRLVNTQYEAKLWCSRVGPAADTGAELDNGTAPDVDDPQAVKVTLNDKWYFDGDQETPYYEASTRYYWRVDSVNADGTTTGDEWYFDTMISWKNERPPDYDADQNYRYEGGEYTWSDNVVTTGGGRYKQTLVVVGHQVIYFGDV